MTESETKEPTFGGQTAMELLSGSRSDLQLVERCLKSGSLVDPIKLAALYDAATELAAKCALEGKERAFTRLMMMLQNQLKIEQPQKHLNLNVNADATDPGRSRLSSIAAKLGVTDVPQ